MFQSNMSKNTVDGNCMTNKMLIVMFSTNPAIGEKNYTNEVKKKVNKKYFFLYLTGFLYPASSALNPSAILAH